MNRQTAWIVALVTVVIVALIALGVYERQAFLKQYERKEVLLERPPSGAARYNPFFALERILTELKVPVTALATVSPERLPLNSGDTLVLNDGLNHIDSDNAERIADWVRDGGHLVFNVGRVTNTARTPLAKALGVLSSKEDKNKNENDADDDDDDDDDDDAASACISLHMDGTGHKDEEVALCGERFWLSSAVLAHVQAVIGDNDKGYLFARINVGDGVVSLLSSIDMMSNRSLRRAPAQYFTRQVLSPLSEEGHVYLVYAVGELSFWKNLFVRGWPAWLAFLLLLAGWMASRSERLGPLMPAPLPQRRALLEHVQATGEFLFRRDAGSSLHALACRYVLAWLQRRDPQVAALDGQMLYQYLAERYQLDPAQITRAFLPPANAAAFCESIAALARLRSRL